MKKVVYISGPITGVERYWEAFEKAEGELEAAGFIALTPTRLPKGLTKRQYTRIDLAMIDAADAVFLLPGWDKSVGCIVEGSYCNRMDKPITDSLETLKEVLA